MRRLRVLLLVALLGGCTVQMAPNPYPNNLLPAALERGDAWARQTRQCQQRFPRVALSMGVRDDGQAVIAMIGPIAELERFSACLSEPR